MSSNLALILWLIASVVLLRIESKANASASLSLWVPTLWAMISGSRPVAGWFITNATTESIDYEAGSSLDRTVLTFLITLALLILIARKQIDWSRVWRENRGLFLFFVLLVVSIVWSDFPLVSLKRAIKTAGVLPMAFIVMSEEKPLQAFTTVFRRCAYILIPLSLVLIKYLPAYGRVYGRWDGALMWTGVATQKNNLGVLCAVSAFLFIVTLSRREKPSGERPQRLRKVADIAVLFLALYMLVIPPGNSTSATSVSICALGVGLFTLLHRRPKCAAFVVQNLKTIIFASVLLYLTLNSVLTSLVTSFFSRRSDLTGRATEIWPFVLAEAAKHPLLGWGYGGVWGLGRELSRVTRVDQAHNGYLDIFLQLGIVGCIVLILFFVTWCSGIQKLFKHDSDWAIIGICFLLMTLVYNMSETSFYDFFMAMPMVLFPFASFGELVSNKFTRNREYRLPLRQTFKRDASLVKMRVGSKVSTVD